MARIGSFMVEGPLPKRRARTRTMMLSFPSYRNSTEWQLRRKNGFAKNTQAFCMTYRSQRFSG